MKVTVSFLFLLIYLMHLVLAQPELISRTLLSYSKEKCKSNPMLNLLPEGMKYTVEITLFSKPKHRIEGFCLIPSSEDNEDILNCCSQFTYSNVKMYLNDFLHRPKQNIHNRNLYYYKQLYDEHKRNLVKGFLIKEADFEAIFSPLHSKIKEIIKLSEDIVDESAQYNWDAFCNYVCYYPSAIERNCNVYRLTYLHNGVEFEDYEYECKVDEERIGQFKKMIDAFTTAKAELNETLNGYYRNIKTAVKSSFQSSIEPQLFSLLMKSMDDGNYVALNLNQPFLCDKAPVSYILNDYINNTISKVNTSCDRLGEAPCGVFSCVEDFFMQFFDVSEFNQSYIIKHFNYSKSKLVYSNKTSMFAVSYANEIEQLIDGTLQFDSGFKPAPTVLLIALCIHLVLFG